MRRKSGRNLNKSVEKSETDSPQRSSESITTRSSRRRKRSPSMATNEVDDKTLINTENNGKSVEVQGSSDNNASNDVEITPNTQLIDSKNNIEENNDIKENQEENVTKEDREIDQEGKGKSKGKNKTKCNHSEIDIETKNDVQGQSVSPPNDNNECSQNSVDSAEKNSQKPELLEFRENVIETDKEEQPKVKQNTLESKSIQSNTVTNIEETVTSENNQEKLEGAVIEERSTTPALPNTTMENKSPCEEKPSNVENKTEKSEKEGRKRITLKRLPPQKLEQPQTLPKEDDKQGKKIILKRRTIDEIPLAGEDVLKSSDARRSSLNETTSDARKRLSSQSEAEDRKRLSSHSEDQNHQEDTSNKPKRIKLVRTISLEARGGEASRKTGKKPWGRSEWLTELSTTLYNIDVDSIRTVCPSVEFLKESDIKLKPAPRDRIKSESSDIVKRKLSLEKSEDETEKHVSEPETTEEQQKIAPNPNIIALNRKISIVDDTASKLRPPASPAKNPRSEILYITNLVRPFTVKQLKELLERTGKIREDGFWTDRIKSKCYAHYETEEEAEATRSALHGVSWPIGNGKQLVIDFGTEEDMQKAKNPVTAIPVVPEILPEKENRFQEPEKSEIRHREHAVEEKKHRDAGRDRSKEEHHRRHSRSRSKERVRKHSRRSYTPEVLIKKKPKKEEVPQKLMDDLFLKTKATPSIYWQPLCPQEIALKQQQRLVRMEEHKRRIEETRSRLRDVRRAPFRRR